MKKYLNAKGKGKHSYDYANDILYISIKGEEYEESIDFNEFIIDFNKDNLIIGLRIIDASKKLNIPKYCLNALKGFRFDAQVNKGEIHLQLSLRYEQRNKQIQNTAINFLRDAPNHQLNDSQATASI